MSSLVQLSKSASLGCILAAIAVGSPAHACLPPAPINPMPVQQDDESDASYGKRIDAFWQSEAEIMKAQQLDWAKKYEAELWSTAKSIVIYRIGSRTSQPRRLGPTTYTRLIPVETFKADAKAKKITLKSYFEDTSCGIVDAGYKPDGAQGDLVMIFSFAAAPKDDAIARLVTPASASNQRTIEAFAKSPRK